MPTLYSIQFLNASGSWSEAVSFADASIVSASRRLVNLGLDTCQIAFAGARPSFAAALAPRTVVRILRDDFDGENPLSHALDQSNPLGWFVGTVVAPKKTVNGNSESASLTLNGPWWNLANLVYRQAGLFYVPTGTKTLSGDTVTNTAAGPQISFGQTQIEISNAPIVLLTSNILVSQGQQSGIPMSAAETLSDYCLAKNPLAFTLGEMPEDLAIPSEQAQDPTCADLVKRVLRWLPSVVSWFDYTQDPPRLNFAARADRAPLAFTMGGDAPQVQQASIQARPDLILSGVTLYFLRRLSLTTTTSTTTTTKPAATTGDTGTGTGTGTGNAGTGPLTGTTSNGNFNSNSSGYISTTQGANATTTDPDTGATTTTTQESTSQEVNILQIDTAGPDPDGVAAMV